MPERPRVDVGVVTWNTRDLTVQALRRLLATDQGVDLRVRVRDNGSVDGTPEAIREQLPEVELDAGPENLGFGRAVNRLLVRSDAPWFLTLNSDAWPEPGAIARMVEAGAAHPRAAVIAPLLLRPDGALEHSTQAFPRPGVIVRAAIPGYARRHPERARELMLPHVWEHDEARPVDWAVGAALLLRRSVVDEIGGFDERLFMYAEDLEWCWRATRAGWEVRFEPSAVVRHVGNASAAQNYGARRIRAYWRNTYRVYRWSHGPGSTLLLRMANLGRTGTKVLTTPHRRDANRFWRRQFRAHLVSTRQPDGPPAER